MRTCEAQIYSDFDSRNPSIQVSISHHPDDAHVHDLGDKNPHSYRVSTQISSICSLPLLTAMSWVNFRCFTIYFHTNLSS